MTSKPTAQRRLSLEASLDGGLRSLTLEKPKGGGRLPIEYTRRPIGNPPVTELKPTTPSQKIRLKHRAGTLIQRYAGANWREAQKTKWMLDVVTHIDMDYREYLMDQAYHIQHLQDQVLNMQSSQSRDSKSTEAKLQDMDETVRVLETKVRDQSQKVLDLQTSLKEAEKALMESQAKAGAAAHQCKDLHEAVQMMAEGGAKTQKSLSNRAYVLKQALRDSMAKARRGEEAERRHKFEKKVVSRIHEQELAVEKEKLQQDFVNQVAAAHQVERAAAQVEVAKVHFELEAYKEPWMYCYGRRSPTRDRLVTDELRLERANLTTYRAFES
eukprot:gene1308-32658_t